MHYHETYVKENVEIELGLCSNISYVSGTLKVTGIFIKTFTNISLSPTIHSFPKIKYFVTRKIILH